MGGGAEHRHDFGNCQSSDYTKCTEIQLQPTSAAPPTPTRGALAQAGAHLGQGAAVGDILATETESDETPFYLVQVIRTAHPVPEGYSSPTSLGVNFEFPRGKNALEVSRFRPATTARGDNSACMFELDDRVKSFLVPCHLLRVGKISLKRVDVVPARNLRRGNRDSITKFELSVARRQGENIRAL